MVTLFAGPLEFSGPEILIGFFFVFLIGSMLFVFISLLFGVVSSAISTLFLMITGIGKKPFSRIFIQNLLISSILMAIYFVIDFLISGISTIKFLHRLSEGMSYMPDDIDIFFITTKLVAIFLIITVTSPFLVSLFSKRKEIKQGSTKVMVSQVVQGTPNLDHKVSSNNAKPWNM